MILHFESSLFSFFLTIIIWAKFKIRENITRTDKGCITPHMYSKRGLQQQNEMQNVISEQLCGYMPML